MAVQPYRGMSLITGDGARKYLSPRERMRFFAALNAVEDPSARTYCEMVFWTGCRPSEALALTALQIDLDEGVVVIRSAKKRGALKGRHFRSIPLPDAFLQRLEATHGLQALQRGSDGGQGRLWRFARTTAWRRMRGVMEAAGLSGAKACAKGLRHSYGVAAALREVPETRIKTWLGHASLETTGVYLDMVGPEDRAMAARLWAGEEFGDG